MEYFSYNGKLFEENRNVIGANSRGLRYGDGLFETIKSHKGQLLFADDHFERMWNGLDQLQFRIPVHLTAGKLKTEILELLEKNRHKEHRALFSHPLCSLCLCVFAGDARN